jgi:hypothetical protein
MMTLRWRRDQARHPADVFEGERAIVNVTAVIFNWSCLAACVMALSLSLTVARRTRWGRPPSQLVLAACVVGEGVELINLYTRASWAPYLFWVGAPFLFAIILAELRSARRAATARP